MTKSEKNVEKSGAFIRRVLRERFNQEVEKEQLMEAAKKLCDSIPDQKAA